MKPNYNNPNSFGRDGVDHINISPISNSQLGKVLDPSYYKTLRYPYLGKFHSVMNLWLWLKTAPLDDSLRKLSGKKLRERVKDSRCSVVHFKAIIAKATYEKLKSYPHLIEEMRRLPSNVRFVSYYYPSGSAVRLCSGYASVIVEIADLLREAFVSGKEPDFISLTTRGCSMELDYLAPFIKEHFGAGKVQELLSL